MQDEFYLKQLTEQHVFGPLLMTLVGAMPRDNLLTSAGLDLFEYIRKENLRELIKYLVENFRQKLVELSVLDTFKHMVRVYDATQGFTVNPKSMVELEADDVNTRPNTGANTRGLMEHLTVDPAEEEYWNGDDDDDDLPRKAEKTVPATNGGTAQTKLLVDYASDEEVDEAPEDEMAVPAPNESTTRQPTDGMLATSTAVQAPERLSEKRRREDDDEDELRKLLQNKRRNSSSSASNSSGLLGGMLRRKKSNISGVNVPGSAKKISISLSPALQAAIAPTEISTGEGNEAQG